MIYVTEVYLQVGKRTLYYTVDGLVDTRSGEKTRSVAQGESVAQGDFVITITDVDACWRPPPRFRRAVGIHSSTIDGTTRVHTRHSGDNNSSSPCPFRRDPSLTGDETNICIIHLYIYIYIIVTSS